MQDNTMYISYSSSNEYAVHTGVSIVSLLENNKDVEKIHVFVLDTGISDERKNKLQEIVESRGRTLSFLPVDDELIHYTVGEKIPEHIGSYATYARLAGPSIFPENVHRVMFVDSDMIITGSVKEIYFADFGSCIVAGVPAKLTSREMTHLPREEEEITKNHKYYINCGLLIVDIDNWKKNKFSEVIREKANSLNDYHFKDQTILNAALDDWMLYKLHMKYNYALHANPQYLIKYWVKKYPQFNKEEIEEAKSNPIVIHYAAGEQSRPWYRENISCLANEYYKYKKISPFYDEALSSLFDVPKYKSAAWWQREFLRMMYKFYQSPVGIGLILINECRMNIQAFMRK